MSNFVNASSFVFDTPYGVHAFIGNSLYEITENYGAAKVGDIIAKPAKYEKHEEIYHWAAIATNDVDKVYEVVYSSPYRFTRRTGFGVWDSEEDRIIYWTAGCGFDDLKSAVAEADYLNAVYNNFYKA